MNMQERLYSVLVVSSGEKTNRSLYTLFPEYRYSLVKFVTDVSAAKRALLEKTYDLILVNSPLPDEDGLRFSIDACSNNSSVVTVLVESDIYPQIIERMTSHGVYLVQKTTSKLGIANRLEWMEVTRERLRGLEKRTLSLEDKMKQIRIVNRAKWILIERKKMSEEEAHRFIEKQAMNNGATREQVAERIIKMFEK